MRSTEATPDPVPVFIEKIEKGSGYILLDFPNEKHHGSFLEKVRANVGEEHPILNDKRSMIELTGVHFGKMRVPREGCYYYLPDNILSLIDQGEPYQGIDDAGGHSNIIAFRLDLSGSNLPFSFGRALSKKAVFGKEYEEREAEPGMIPIDEFDAIKSWAEGTTLVAMNVGQGNWNEVHFKDGNVILYDIGASVRFTAKCIDSVIRRSKIIRVLNEGEAAIKCTLIISHWDIDHYQAIFQVDDAWIRLLHKVIYMAHPPTRTSERALEKIVANTHFRQRIEVAPCSREPGRGKSSVLHTLYKIMAYTY
ncbi:hypothetical protein H7F15_12045 [Pontibacter sp. Tf4]|uniref:hypothetical protein n=1 Tax=Pontibacter sp. Tf4 TaxID=2761620 RepID=UPI00162558DD|nr:hypothetical protein [Pontibacter sp. Tf4]MBB6611773.1 hypothetical protein [Pontibacter sp. Tf4]